MENNEYIKKIPCTIFGFTGPVAAGKTECTYNLTGKWTTQHSSEKKRNMSRKSGYAGLKIWKDNNDKLYSTDSSIQKFSLIDFVDNKLKKIFKKLKKNIKEINYIFKSQGKYKLKNINEKDTEKFLAKITEQNNKIIEYLKNIYEENDYNDDRDCIEILQTFENIITELSDLEKMLNLEFELINHLSIIDCPGHHEVMDTMLTNVDIMSNTIIIVSASIPIKLQPQLKQHLAAIKMSGIRNIIICINKIDLVDKNVVKSVKNDLDDLLDKLDINPKIIIPTAFKKKVGHQTLLKSIIEYFPSNSNLNGNNNNNLIGQISRSFDINKSNQSYEKIKGGVLGGSIILGSLSLDSEIEIRPGRVVKNKNGLLCKPLITKVMSIKSEKISIEKAFPGCLIGIGTLIDPYCCKGDELVGNVFGLKGNMPNVYYPDITINFKICKELGYDWKISKNDKVNFQIGTLTIRNCNLKNIIKNKKNNKIAVFTLSQPCCFDENNNIIISKKTLDGIKVIIGYGNMTSGDIVNLT